VWNDHDNSAGLFAESMDTATYIQWACEHIALRQAAHSATKGNDLRDIYSSETESMILSGIAQFLHGALKRSSISTMRWIPFNFSRILVAHNSNAIRTSYMWCCHGTCTGRQAPEYTSNHSAATTNTMILGGCSRAGASILGSPPIPQVSMPKHTPRSPQRETSGGESIFRR
jgi:hypothetical protein